MVYDATCIQQYFHEYNVLFLKMRTSNLCAYSITSSCALQLADVENPGMTVRVDKDVIPEWRLYMIMVLAVIIQTIAPTFASIYCLCMLRPLMTAYILSTGVF